MDAEQVKYTVREDRTIKELPEDDFERIPCWSVTRETRGSMAWHIGKYDSEAAALDVVAALTKSIPHELS